MRNTNFYNRCKAKVYGNHAPVKSVDYATVWDDEDAYGIFIPKVAGRIALELSRPTLEATNSAFKG